MTLELPEPLTHDLSVRQAQQIVDRWIQTIGVRYFDEMTNLAQLVEEVGEVARILSRTCGEQSVKAGTQLGELSDELADVLFVVICLANQSGIDLTEALSRNLDKKTNRDRERHRNNPKLTQISEASRCEASRSPDATADDFDEVDSTGAGG